MSKMRGRRKVIFSHTRLREEEELEIMRKTRMKRKIGNEEED